MVGVEATFLLELSLTIPGVMLNVLYPLGLLNCLIVDDVDGKRAELSVDTDKKDDDDDDSNLEKVEHDIGLDDDKPDVNAATFANGGGS